MFPDPNTQTLPGSPVGATASGNPSSFLDYLKMVAPLMGQAGGPMSRGGGQSGNVRYAPAPEAPSSNSSGRDAALKMGTSALGGGGGAGAAAGGAAGGGAAGLLGSL